MIFFSKFKFNQYIAITIWPIIIINKKYKGDKVLVNHEKIHIKQQLELLWLPFFIWYFIEFIIRYVQYKNWNEAYLNLSFEREARDNEWNLNYLKTRKWYGFFKYL
ncbi:MAG: hypothetical protein V3U80_02580 [Flavobacteriaceae bacterium]